MPLYRQQLICDKSAPRRARAWVADVLSEIVARDERWHPDVVADAVLCASELVTNSLIANSTTMTLAVSVEPGMFRLSLVDDSPVVTDRRDPVLRAQLIGFRLIAGVADGWGIDPADVGRELWAVFRTSDA